MRPPEQVLSVRGSTVAGRVLSVAAVQWLVLAIALLAMLMFAATLRPGQDWGDDFAMYVLHARAFAEGLPFAQTGFLPNPWGVPGPPTYPPVYPAMLAPLYSLWGLDYEAMKLVTVLCHGVAVVVIDRLMSGRLEAAERVALALVLAFNPWFWDFKDEVRSDVPFLMFCYLTLLVGGRMDRGGAGSPWPTGLLLGVLAYLAYGTRSLGIMLLPCIAMSQLLATRRLGRPLLIGGVLLACLVLGQNLWLHSDGGYEQSFTLDPSVIGYNMMMYMRAFGTLWLDGVGGLLRITLFSVVSALALIGYVHAVRRKVGVLELFPWLYLAPIVCYYVGTMIQQRYVMPVVPLYLYYALLGLRSLATFMPGLAPAVRRGALAVLATLVVAQYVSYFARADYGPIRDGVTSADASEVFDYLRKRAAPEDVIVMGKARACALYTGRDCASPFGYRTDMEIRDFLAASGARFVVLGSGALAAEMDYEHPDDWPQFAAGNPRVLLPLLTAGNLTIYGVGGSDEVPL